MELEKRAGWPGRRGGSRSESTLKIRMNRICYPKNKVFASTLHYEKTGDLNASLDQLARSPGLEWVGQLRNDPRVNWVEVEARFDEWDYENQGLTEVGASLVASVVGLMSGGALSNLSVVLAETIGFAADGALQAALKVGLESLAKRAGVALVDNQGDIGATLDTLGSSASVRSLATAMATTGLTAHISDVAGIGDNLPETAPLADRVAQDIRRNLVWATVNANISLAIEDGAVEGGALYERIAAALRQSAGSVIGENTTQEIDQAFHSGEINRFAKILAHGVAECVSKFTSSGDYGSGALEAFDKATVDIQEDVKKVWREYTDEVLDEALELFHEFINQQ